MLVQKIYFPLPQELRTFPSRQAFLGQVVFAEKLGKKNFDIIYSIQFEDGTSFTTVENNLFSINGDIEEIAFRGLCLDNYFREKEERKNEPKTKFVHPEPPAKKLSKKERKEKKQREYADTLLARMKK